MIVSHEGAPPPICGLVIALNEADRIGECLQSMRPVCRQLVVVDAGSTDGTAEIARCAGAEVLVTTWHGFARQRNLALDLATYPWVLFLDADERLSPQLRGEILDEFGAKSAAAAARRESLDGYDIRFRTRFLGRDLRFGPSIREHHVRLFRSSLRFAERRVHELIAIDRGRVARLRGHVVHDTARGYGHYQRKLARYAELHAADRAAAGRRSSIWRGRINAAHYWLKNYWIHAGFLDGSAGYAYHRLHAEYVFDKHARLWERTSVRMTGETPEMRPE